MNINTNGDYNRVQINFTEDRTPSGQIMKQSLMLNIREDSVQKAYQLYKELKAKIDQNGQQTLDGAEEETEMPLCPDCKIPMVLKQNSKNGNRFYSCPNWRPDRNGCNQTRPYLLEKEETVEQIPF